MDKKLEKARLAKVKDIFDKILSEYHNREFSEFVGLTGGDARTFRVYGNSEDTFQVYER